MTFPFGFDDLNYINSQLTPEEQFGSTGLGGTSSGNTNTNTNTNNTNINTTNGCPNYGQRVGCADSVGTGIFSTGTIDYIIGQCETYNAYTEECVTPCNYADRSTACSNVLGQGYTGTATRTELVTDSTGKPLPLGCKQTPEIATDWNTSECVATTVNCNYADRSKACTELPGFTGYTGTATRTELVKDASGKPLPLGCKETPGIATDWNTSECKAPPTCETVLEPVACSDLAFTVRGNRDRGNATRVVLKRVNGQNIPAGCSAPGNVGDIDTSNCSAAPPTCDTEVTDVDCAAVPGIGNKTAGKAKKTAAKQPNTPANCVVPDITYDTTTCSVPVGSCTTTTETKACNQLQGFTNHTGNATRTVVSTNAQNQPLPLGCTVPNNVPSEWNTSACVAPTCETELKDVLCSNLSVAVRGTRTLGIAKETVLKKTANGQNIPAGCTTPGTVGNIDTTGCSAPNACQTELKDVLCSNVPTSIRGTKTIGTAKQTVLKKVNNQNTPAGCIVPDTVDAYDITGCTAPDACQTEQIEVPCSNVPVDIRGTKTAGTAKQIVLKKVNGENTPAGCIVPDGVNTYNISTCTTPPAGACNTVEESIACARLQGFANYTGTATRQVSTSTPAGCNATGLPTAWNTSTCTPPVPPTHRICGDPSIKTGAPPSEFVEDTDQYAGKCYRPVVPPPTYRLCGNPAIYQGLPPQEYVEARDQYQGVCYQPRPRWRSCIDGNLRDGTPPSDQVQRTYNGAGGGVCWEPVTTVGFEPNLAAAFNFTYKRGTSQYPSAVRVRASNPSYAVTYRVKLETNNKIKLNDGNGILSFTLPPRGTYDFTLNVSAELYEQLGDGSSTLSLNVEIE
jgi:hypothetical protein